jgi:DNA polymerase-3 subunit alpha
VPVPIEQIRSLIRVGAFSFTGQNKKELLWKAYGLVNPNKKVQAMQELFTVEPKKFTLPKLSDSWLDSAFDEIELLGFSLSSPFSLLKETPDIPLTSKELKANVGKTVEIIGYHVNTKVTSTVRGETMCFGTFLDREGLWIDTTHFPPVLKAYPFKGPGCYVLKGKVVDEFDFVSIEITEMHHIPMLNPEDDRALAEQRQPTAGISIQ